MRNLIFVVLLGLQFVSCSDDRFKQAAFCYLDGNVYEGIEVAADCDSLAIVEYMNSCLSTATTAHFFFIYKNGRECPVFNAAVKSGQIFYLISKNCPDIIYVSNYGNELFEMECSDFKR